MSDPGEPVVYRGRYILQQSIGKGGMAEVFLAQDQLLDRPVAVKRLAAEHADDASFVERFRREAQAAAKLTHPNIVAVYDYFEEDGDYFIVQEFIDGRSLAELLQAEVRLHPDRAADIAADIAAGLGAAHREGMVHRDIKAGNVLVAQDGHVKVADFGIARVFAGGDSELTQAGTVMGTATYFSPEQAQGKAVDPRSDLYSLGVVLFEMLVGRPPFSGDEPVAIAYAHVHTQPESLRAVDPALPREIDAITSKLLSKDPADRYPSADDLRADLRRFRQGAKIDQAPPAPAPVPVPVPAGPEIDFGSYEDSRYVEPPRRTGFFLLFMVLVFATLAAGLWYLSEQLDEDRGSVTVTVPDVVGENKDRARARAGRAGLPGRGPAGGQRGGRGRRGPPSEPRARDRGRGRLAGDPRDQRGQRDRSGAVGAGPGRVLGHRGPRGVGVRRPTGTGRGPEWGLRRGSGVAAEPALGNHGGGRLDRDHPGRAGAALDHHPPDVAAGPRPRTDVAPGHQPTGAAPECSLARGTAPPPECSLARGTAPPEGRRHRSFPEGAGVGQAAAGGAGRRRPVSTTRCAPQWHVRWTSMPDSVLRTSSTFLWPRRTV